MKVPAESGHMNWFLNTNRKLAPAAREDPVIFLGNGDNIVSADNGRDFVAPIRWLDDKQKAEFVRLLQASIAQRLQVCSATDGKRAK